MTIKKAKAHEIRCQGVGGAGNEEAETMHESLDRSHRSEGDNSTTGTHQHYSDEDNEDDNEEEEEGDDGDGDIDEGDDEDGDDGDDDDDDNSYAAFVENFLRRQDIDANRKRRLQEFSKVCCTYTFAVSNR
jgi:hypothetical protein